MKEKTGLAGLGIVTAEAVTLFKSSLRCGASGAKRLPCPYRHKKQGQLSPCAMIADFFFQSLINKGIQR
ncbi:hypothetical protein FGZ66_15575 [Shigella sonnei]|nr:hypothetical protein [Shigella sonnei]EFX7686104.1 hypothetical protein [Shigella flexneri]MLY59189.1 hypothetical protein [Shigella flexneri]